MKENNSEKYLHSWVSSLTPKTKQNNLKPVMIFSPFGQSSNEPELSKKKTNFFHDITLNLI